MTLAAAIDLSRLPAPEVVETLDYERVLETLRARFEASALARGVAIDTFVESDPVMILLEAAAYEIVLERQQRNDDARALMLAYAAGADLEQIAANVGVYRRQIAPADPSAIPPAPAVLEGDADLRRRAQLAPESWTNAGTGPAYIFHALSIDGVLDASATSPAPGEVEVTVLGTGGVTTPALVDAVRDHLLHEDIRQLTDDLAVQGATAIPFDVTAALTLYPGPAAGPILAEAGVRLDAHLATLGRLGHDVTRSGLFAALHVPGVQNVTLTAPAADLVIAPHEAAIAGTVTVSEGGRDV